MGQAPVFVSPKDSLDADRCSVQGLAPLDLQHCVLMILRMEDTIVLLSLPHPTAPAWYQVLVSKSQDIPDSPMRASKEGTWMWF